MIRALAAALVLLSGSPGAAAAQETAGATAQADALAAFDPLIGRWRGASITDPSVVDELSFERAAGGGAIRSFHAVGGGAYAGETLITFDKASGGLISLYATNGGFHTTGTVEVRGPGAFVFDQTVHGLDGVTGVRATTEMADGVYRIRSEHLIGGSWVDTGGFDYRRAD